MNTPRYRTGKRLWEPEDDALLVRRYPDEATAVLATELGRTTRAVYMRAKHLSLAKSEAFYASDAGSRIKPGERRGVATQFRPGQVPPNKGLRRPGWAPGRMRETQFRRGVRQGVAARNWMPVGSIRVDPEGYQRIKVREWTPGEATGFGNSKIWSLHQRYLWEQAHGPIPPGHSVVFRDGNRTNCVLENLELITRAELMRRNTIHKLPAPLKATIQVLGRLTRQIRKRSRDAEEQDRRSA